MSNDKNVFVYYIQNSKGNLRIETFTLTSSSLSDRSVIFCNVIQYYSILIGSLLHVIQLVRQTAWYNAGQYVVWIWVRWIAAGSIAAFSRVPSLIYGSSYCPCGVLLVSVWVSTRIFGFLQTPKNMPTDGLDTLNCPLVSICVCVCVRTNLRYTGIPPLHILLACAQCFQDDCETVTEDEY